MAVVKGSKSAQDQQKNAAKATSEADAAKRNLADVRARLTAVEQEQTSLIGAKTVKEEIRQGVKAAVETVPMPVRLEVNQVKALKILAAMQGTTASAIIRGCIHDQLIEMYDQLPGFSDALKAAGVRGL